MTPLDYSLVAVFHSIMLVPLAMAYLWEYRIEKLSQRAERLDAAVRARL